MLVEEFCRRPVAANLHVPKLVQLPGIQVRRSSLRSVNCFSEYTRAIDAPYEGDVHAHIAVNTRAIEANVHPESHARPRRVARMAVEARLYRDLAASHLP